MTGNQPKLKQKLPWKRWKQPFSALYKSVFPIFNHVS
jgi:hypothetical protein